MKCDVSSKTHKALIGLVKMSVKARAGLDRLRRNPEQAQTLLTQCLRDQDYSAFLLALLHMAQSHGMSVLSRELRVERSALYRSLSVNGDHDLNSVHRVLMSLGFELVVVAAKFRR